MREISLQEMQKIELNILIWFDEFCRTNSLKYYIDGGTLLGAMCYGGFIPWDDDIDLKMPRPDYEKLKSLKNKLPENIYLDMPSDEHCEYLFSKLIDNRTVLIEADGKHTGVYVDIFPMDGYPENDIDLKNHLKKLSKLNTLFHSSLDSFSKMKKSKTIVTKVKGYLCSCIYSPKALFRTLEKTAKKYNYNDSVFVGLLIEGDPDKEKFERQYLDEPAMLKFEEHFFPASQKYKEHLCTFYGNHVLLPECCHNLPRYPSQHQHQVYWKEEN